MSDLKIQATFFLEHQWMPNSTKFTGTEKCALNIACYRMPKYFWSGIEKHPKKII